MPKVQIVISFDGQSVSVAAPMEDKVLCYGMLAAAEHLIHDYVASEQPIVKPATSLPPGLLKP